LGDVKTIIIKDSLSPSKQGVTRAERSATVTSVIDSKSIRTLASAIEKLITSRKGGLDTSSLEKTLIRVLKTSLKATGQTGGVSKDDLSRVAKEAGRVIAKEFVNKVISKQIQPGRPSAGLSTSAVTKAIENGIKKAAGIIARETAKASKGSVVIDDKLLAGSIKAAIAPLVPRSLPQTGENITKSFGAVKKLMREIDLLSKSIGSMRKSGGGIDVMEMPKVLASLKKVAADAIELGKALTQTKNSIKTMVGESSDSFKELSTSIDNVKTSVKDMVSDVRRKASEDRVAFTKEVFGEVRKVFASKAFKDTELARVIKSLEGKIGTVGDLASSFKSIGTEFKKAVQEGTIKIENVDQIISKFDHLISNLSALPDKMSVEGTISPEYKKFLKTLEGFSKGIKGTISEVKLVIDDSGLKKLQEKGIKIKADIDVNQRSIDVTAQDILKTIQKAVSEAVENALKYPKQLKLDIEAQTLKATLKELESAVSDVSLNRVQKVISELEKSMGSGIERLEYASKKVNDLLEYNASKAIKIRGVSEKPKSVKVGLGSKIPIPDRYKLLKEALTIPSYKEKVISTEGVGGIRGTFDELSSRTRITDMNRQLLVNAEQGMNELSISLKRLQKSIIEGLDRTFQEASSGWGVVKTSGEQDPSKIFKRTDRQWTVDIADVSRLQRRFKGVGGGSKELVEAYMKEKVTKMEAPTDMRVMADAIGRWLKQTSESQIKSWDVNIKDVESQLIDIQKSIKGVAPDESSINRIVSTFGTSLESIFKNTYQRAEARRMMQNEKLVRTITLPLATLTPQGIPSFQTTHGSLRALPKFAQFTSGFEELHSRLEKSKMLKREKGYAGQIKEVGIMPTDRNLFLAENLASNMIKDLASASKESKAFILSQFKEAATMRGVEVARSKQLRGSEFEKEVRSFSLNINKIVDAFAQAGSGNLGDLVSTLEKMELSAYDLVRSLDQVKFENVYDIYRKILVPETGGGPVEKLGKEPRFERSIREYEQAVGQLTGLFPLIERSRPRRALHQSNIVNMLTRTGSIYGGEDVLGPTQQKTFIKDLNLRLGEMVREAQTLQKIHMGESSRIGKLPTDVSALSSLGIPEEQAGKIEEYRKDMFTPGTRFLKELNATAVKMYSDTLSELAPFGAEFQQIGRNISNVTNAMIDAAGKADFPKLVTEKERGIVESGFYGKKGYGFNVIAELRNTAATFEDQVIVSGKLADAVTSAVSVLVTPSPGGRVGAPPSETFGVASEEMEIKAGQILKSNVEEAAREFQKILGVPKRYPGRADEALIESVKKVLTVVRGEDIEVQQAKIAETFLNYFGRKFTTRYGAKGVGVTPTRPVGQILGEAYEKYGVKGVQVLTGKEREKAGLGVARLPKSMGELVAEIMEENISALRGKGYSDTKIEETKRLFVESGNKFLLDIFKDLDQGVTTAAGATKSKKVFEKYKSVMDILYDDSEVVGQFEEISRLKKRWEDALKEQAKFYKEVPIDIRISAHGLAKRGLQTEILETVMNNIIGVGAGQTVLSTRMKQDVYSKLLGGPGQQGLLSQYSGALGFKGAAKPPEVIAKEMMGKETYEEARKLKESLIITPGMKFGPEATKLISEYDITMRAAVLESTSNYYSEIIDEIGKKRKSLVGEKFIQIIEEPHFDPGWALGQIEKGIKGERLDIPAYSAYATIFGEQSAMMKEIQDNMTLNAKKHWEYLKALQFLNKESTELVANLQKGLETVDIKDIKAFDYSTGIYDKTGASPRSFKETILDIEKRPSSFVLGLPTAQREVTEPFYVPGALARETYPEPLVAGERGIGDISRRLVHVVNMAKELQDVLDQPEKFVEASEIRRALPKIIPQQLKVFWSAVRARAETPELEAAAQELIDKWFRALSGVKGTRVDQLIAPGFQATEQEYISSVLKRQFAKVQTGEKTKLAAYTTTLGAMSDLLIGPSPETIRKQPEKAKASKIMETYISIGKGGEFAQTLGVDLSENVIKRRVENLEKAKIDYYSVLAETALGKKGSVEEVFFSRKIPAIMGKAVTAVVDKTENLKNFAKELDKIEKDLGKSLEDERQALNDLILVHQATVATYKEKVGLPVLKQHELGVPASFAKKIPVEFEKRYEVKDTSIKEAEKGTEIVKGTLYDMLKYIGDLRAATNYEDNKLLIDKYIKDALVPFIESVRYPFTGVSSVQPYEAKLVQDLDKFAENVLMVPGVPELDFGKFKSIISSLEGHMKGLLVEREVLMGKSTTEDLTAAENLTKTINLVDKAISEVIPKYAAHQQKLDFDGDQIEIHAARTKEARQEIAQHLQHMKGTELTTERVFREKFISGAVIGSTGEFTMAEMAKSFEKKFPVEKGFDFLKTPFLTKELEYLTPEKSLDILAERKGMDPVLTLSKAVQGVIRNQEAYFSFFEEMKKLETGKSSKEVLSAANLIARNIKGIDEKIIQSAIKTQLYNEKYKDAIEAQLFKIHTGAETQALYRLHRLAELTVGFGSGQIGTGVPKPSPTFKSKFPTSYEEVTGATPEKEFHTMINEIVRFAIQKGMDVKHAGTVPVAGEMVKLIAKGRGGVEELWKNILDESDSSYSELRDFYEANKEVLKRRAGGMKTGELVSSLSEIYEIEDLPKKELVGLGREELISKIVEQFGLKGFLNRLSDIVYEEAVNGLISQVESWTPETRARRGVKGDVSSWAENYVKKQTEDIRGINIRELIEEAQQPLYSMRTGMAAPKEELRKFKSKFGDLPMAEFPTDAFSKEFRQEYMDKYQRAKATAKNIQRELEMFTSSSQGGAYADMLRATSKVMFDEQAQIEDIISGLEKRGYDINVEAGKSLVDRALKSLDKFPEYIKSILEIPDEIKRSKAIEELFKLASIPQITETEETARRFELYPAVFKEAERRLVKEKGYSRDQFDEEEFERLLEAKANELLERALNLAQIDRALKGMSRKVYESRVLTDLLPSVTGSAFVSTRPTEAQKTVMAASKERITRAKYGPKVGGPPVRPTGLPSGVDIGGPGIGVVPQHKPGDIVPVRVVSVDSGVTIGISGISVKDLIAAAVGRPAIQPEMDPDIFKKFDMLGEADKIYAALFKKLRSQEAPVFDKDTVSTFERFTAGALYTGGKFEKGFNFDPAKAFQDQVEAITDYIMNRLKDPDWASQLRMGLGTVLHEKIQRRMEKSSLEQGKKLKFEKLIKDVETRGGPISGFADIVEYSVDNFGKEVVKKVSDIKTVSKFDIDELRKAAGGGKKASYGELVKKIEDPKVRGRLETAISQVNVYLKGLSEYAQGEILFFDRLKKGEEEPFVVEFGYSEERFQRDIDALIKAREIATEELSKKGIKVIKGIAPLGTKSTISREYSIKKEKEKPDITDKEINVLIDTMITLLSKEQLRPRKAPSKEYSGLSDKVEKVIKNVKEEEARAKLYAKTSYDKFIEPTPVAAGEGIKSVLENLRSLHDQALLYQQGKMLDFSVLKDFDKTIQDVIMQVSKEGKSAALLMEAIDSVNTLAVDPKEKIQGKDLMKLWKLYRIARGEWLLKKAEQARKDLDAAEKVDDWREANKAYGTFETAVKETQRFIVGSLGKMSDIYTEDKRFVYPGLAQAAGVYKDPRQIAISAAGPLGEDEELQRIFKNMTRDLGTGREVVAPIDKIRNAFRDLTGTQKDMVDILTNARKLKRVGPEIIEAWDFSKLVEDVSRLRAAMDQLARYNEFEADKRTNLDTMRKYLKRLENTYAGLNLEMKQTVGIQKEWGQLDLIPVSKFETPTQQLALHERNVQKVREYFITPEEAGGPKERERFSYPIKVFGDTGEVIKNVIVQFRKHGEGLNSAGEHVSKFVETQKDMIEWMQRSGASFESALRRVVMWGAASRLVYGGIAKLKSSLDEISGIEVSVAQLRMVMSPLETDFTKLQKAAIGFAKTYGLGVNDVLVSMKVFAQQGLSQKEVIDRTRVATLAANVTTLDSKAATEALTAAMKIFREEGTSAVRFLDAWSETEAKHAITAADMANAIKKSAAAAKTAGVTFDELNGIVAAIGSVTRQSGKEVGTAMRFIFRRLFSEKGPKALAEIGIPAITGEGELRRGFEVLNDLAGQWKDLTQAQKLNLAQSLGGTRQYNALIVLMDQWDEALRGIRNSTNSKGSAERRNLEIMKTYAKQLQQTKAAVTELKIGFGKIVLPSFKVGLKALKMVLETINAMPTTVKAAAVAIGSLFVLGAKGINMFSVVSKYWKRGEAEIVNLGKSFSRQMKIVKFELTGKGAEKDIFGLKTALPSASKMANLYKPTGSEPVKMGKKWSDFHSIIGASVFKLRDWGIAYNKFLGNLGSGTEKVFKGSGDALQGFAKKLDKFDWKWDLALFAGTKFTPGIFDDILSGMVSVGVEATEQTSKYLGKALSFTGKTFGKGTEGWLKSFAAENTDVVKALLPLGATVAAGAVAISKLSDKFNAATKSAQDFEKTMYGARRKSDSELKVIRELSQQYEILSKKLEDVNKAAKPETKVRRQELGTYEAPLKTMRSMQQDLIGLSNSLADQNLSLISGYNELGNAVLRSSANFGYFLKEIDKVKVQNALETEITVINQYVRALTDVGSSEKIKKAFKDLTSSMPVVGGLISKQIKVSPALVLKEASKELNRLVNIKNKYPLSTAVDEDIQRLQDSLTEARNVFKETYSDLSRVFGDAFSKAGLKGLNKSELEKLFTRPELLEVFKIMVQVNPEFSLVKGVKPEDLMAKELLQLIYPQVAGVLDVDKLFTISNFESIGKKISDGLKRGGRGIATFKFEEKILDTVWEKEELAKNLQIAGSQAILEFKQTTDNVYDWVATYFNTKTLQIEEVPFSKISKFADAIFPLDSIKEDLTYRMDALNTFVAGAAAGLTGISVKDFKKDFDLGARFFSQIPTTLLLQGGKGFEPQKAPESRYGAVKGMEKWGEEIKRFYFKPMEDLKTRLESVKRLQAPGLEDSVTLTAQFHSEVQKLLTTLKNNQAVFQFRALFVDLMKEFAESERVLRQNLAVQKKRNELDVETSGLMAGVSKALSVSNLGTRRFSELSPHQRLLLTDEKYRKSPN
jgi:TP901 family phage tail tape measure protein